MSPAERAAYQRGVMDVLAIISATATHIESSGFAVLRRELATETLRALAEEGAALIPGGVNVQPSMHRPVNTDRRQTALALGYVGESCPDCANFTLVRNGTWLKCETCGSTTGCS